MNEQMKEGRQGKERGREERELRERESPIEKWTHDRDSKKRNSVLSILLKTKKEKKIFLFQLPSYNTVRL